MKIYIKLLTLCALILLVISSANGADNQTPTSFIARIIRPWPGLGDRPESEDALLNWDYSVQVLKNEEINYTPEVTISSVFDVYSGYCGAIEISTHGGPIGHSIEIYPYDSLGQHKRDSIFTYKYYSNDVLCYRNEKPDVAYFIGFRYSGLPL